MWSAMCLRMKPRLCMWWAKHFASGVMRTVGGIARHPRKAQRGTTRRLSEPNRKNKTCNKTSRRTTKPKSPEGWSKTPDECISQTRVHDCSHYIPQWEGTDNCESTIGRRCWWSTYQCLCLSFKFTLCAWCLSSGKNKCVHTFMHRCKSHGHVNPRCDASFLTKLNNPTNPY